ncbi:MAG TPA: PTS sugar transporter subunit IIA [Geobacteraceae bacterium]
MPGGRILKGHGGGEMSIVDILHPEDIIPSLAALTKDAVLEELAAKLAQRHPELDPRELCAVLQERERLGSTGIGEGLAIPHGKVKRMQGLALVFGRSPAGVDFSALDGRPVHLFFLLVAPEEAVGVHLKMLARISRILKNPAVRRGLLEAPDAAAIYTIIHERDCSY